MGQIINTKNLPNKKVVCRIIIDQDEMAQLEGHMKNIHVFSSNLCAADAQINTRGNNGVTKYFKIPLSVRSRQKHNNELISQKLETPTKTFYLYTLGKKDDNDDDINEKDFE